MDISCRLKRYGRPIAHAFFSLPIRENYEVFATVEMGSEHLVLLAVGMRVQDKL